MNPKRDEWPEILVDPGTDHPQLTASDPPDAESPSPASGDTRTLLDDIADLLLDAKTYIDAELSYQKTRASFVGDRLKTTVAMGVVAAVIAFIAAIGLTVGLIIALTPLITAWGATVVVVGGMLLITYLMLKRAGAAWGEMMDAIKEDRPGTDSSETERDPG